VAQRKTSSIAGGMLIAGALTFSAAIPAQAVSSEPRPGKRSTPEITVAMIESGKAKLKQGDRGRAVSQVQKRLTRVGIITPITGFYNRNTARNVARFNEKFRGFSFDENQVVSKIAWKKLKRESTVKIPRACRTKQAALCISKRQKVVRYYKKGRLVSALDARFGAPNFQTRNGNFKIFRKVKNDYSTLYKTPMPWSMYFSGGQAVHYSFYFPKDGYYGASHGCVNIRDKRGIIKMWRKVKIGTYAKVY